MRCPTRPMENNKRGSRVANNACEYTEFIFLFLFPFGSSPFSFVGPRSSRARHQTSFLDSRENLICRVSAEYTTIIYYYYIRTTQNKPKTDYYYFYFFFFTIFSLFFLICCFILVFRYTQTNIIFF